MKFLLLLIIVFIQPTFLTAQEIVFITQPAAQKVGLQDAFEVKYILKNMNSESQFSLENMNNFQLLNRPTPNYNTTIINGNSNSSVEITCVLRAKKSGKLTLPNAIATFSNGKKIRSNIISIDVVTGTVVDRRKQQQRDPMEDFFGDDEEDPFAAVMKQQQQIMRQLQQQRQQNFPSTQPRQVPTTQQGPVTKNDIDKNIFIVAIPDKTNVMLGEQITVSYKLFTRLPMNIQPTKNPSLVGFWSQDFKIQNPPQAHREVYQGKEYDVLELKRTALFPTQIGTLELDAAEAEGTVRIAHSRQSQNGYNNNGSIESMLNSMLSDEPFEEAFNYEEVPVKLKSQPIKINVTDIPTAQKPNSFNGAIGNYTMESNIDKTELTTDDNATITLTVSGTGNLKLIGNPTIQFPADIDSYEPKIMDTISNTNDIIAGYKTFKYSFTPRIAGTFTIPSTAFSYFDPSSKEYKTLTTPTYTLHIKQGKNDEGYATRLPKDIHDIQTENTVIKKSNSINIIKSPIYWSGFGIPIFAYFGLLFFKRKENELQSNTVLYKNRSANKVALKRLSLAENYLHQTAQSAFYEETSKAVWLYLSDKLNIPLSKLSKEIAANKLKEKNVSSDLQIELFRITNDCEVALYSPDNGTLKMHQTYSDSIKLIGKLEEQLA